MKSLNQNLVKLIAGAIVCVTLFSSVSQACASRKSQAREIIHKTAYVIDEVYDVVSYYDYWQGSALSKAVYYNDYAQQLYRHRSYSRAINYSLLARQYAVDVINSCDDYWEYFFYTYFGWSYAYGHNSRYNSGYAAGYRDGYYDAYYRVYCNRYDHYDSHYNPHGNNHHKNPNDYNDSHNGHQSSSTIIGRGENSSTRGGSTSTGNGGRERIGSNSTSFKDISTNQYFDSQELQLVRKLPNETSLETDFKKANPTKTFDDSKIAKDTKTIETNRTAAKEFKPVDKKDAPKFELSKPAKVVSERPQKIETPSKPTEIGKDQSQKKPVQQGKLESEKQPVQTTDKPARTIENKMPEVRPVTKPKQTTAPKQTNTSTTKKPARTTSKQTETKKTNSNSKSDSVTSPTKSNSSSSQKNTIKNSSTQRNIR